MVIYRSGPKPRRPYLISEFHYISKNIDNCCSSEMHGMTVNVVVCVRILQGKPVASVPTLRLTSNAVRCFAMLVSQTMLRSISSD